MVIDPLSKYTQLIQDEGAEAVALRSGKGGRVAIEARDKNWYYQVQKI